MTNNKNANIKKICERGLELLGPAVLGGLFYLVTASVAMKWEREWNAERMAHCMVHGTPFAQFTDSTGAKHLVEIVDHIVTE